MPRRALALLALLVPVAASASAYDREVAARAARLHHLATSRPHAAAGLVPLLGLSELWELVDDREALWKMVAAAADNPRLSPDVRAYAHALLWQWRPAGPDARTASDATLGLVQACEIIGPFDNEGRRGHSTVYPPEQEEAIPGAGVTYEGRNRVLPPTWRPVPRIALARDGRILLDNAFRPNSWVTAYAACYVRSDRSQPAAVAVRVGSAGPIKVWVNRGPPVIDHDVYRPLRIDQDVGGATLLPGWNRILVKISSGEGPLSFLLRLTTPDGRPMPGLIFSERPPQVGWRIPRALPARVRPSSLLHQLRAALGAAPHAERSQALRDLGIYLLYIMPQDESDRQHEALLAEAQRLDPTLEGAWLLAMANADLDYRRWVLEGARTLPGGSAEEWARLFLALGQVYESAQREGLAEQAYREAVQLDPSLHPAVIQLAQLQADRGLPAAAERMLAELPGRSLRLLRARLALAMQRGRMQEVEQGYLRLMELEPDDLEAHRQLLDRSLSRGDTDGALGWLERILQRWPELLWAHQQRVELLEGAGRLAKALAELDALLEALPGEPELHELRARLLRRLGRTEEALASLQRSLELRPQNPELRTYLAHLVPAARQGEDLVQAYREDVRRLIREAAANTPTGDPARVLLDQRVTRVHDNGLSEVFTQRVVQILDEQGAREYASYEIRYTPETQSVQVKAAKVYKADGQVQQTAQQEEQDASEPWYRLYYDVRALTLHFAGLQPGDVIDIEYVVADIGRRNLLADYFGDLHLLQEEVPRLDSRYVVLVSEPSVKRRPLYFNTPRSGPGWTVERSERLLAGGKEREYCFRARGVPRIENEPDMPGPTEVASFVHVSTWRSWEDLARWYLGLVEEQLRSSPEIAAAARAAVAGLRDARAKVRAIYNLVVRKTRYVGLEFGIHGYKPYKATQVFARKFGDCKDKAVLLKVMLREVGIDSSLVLARTRRAGDIEPAPASLAAFDHALVFVPALELYLDGTAEFSGSEELPEQDQDIVVLILSDPRPPWNGRGHLARTPVLPAARNVVRRELHVALHPDGSAEVSETTQVAGQEAQRWREHYEVEAERAERYEKAWNEHFPSVQVRRVSLSGVEDLERPVVLRGMVHAPSWGQPSPMDPNRRPELVLRPLGRDPELLRNFARLSRRSHDLILGFPWRSIEVVKLQLPPGLQPKRLPVAQRLESPFGRFWLEVASQRSRQGIEVVITADLQVERHRIARADYEAFRRFCTEVDAAVAQELVVGHE
ncbi:MAG: DUF3857 domain-containing protein [Myxococcales bacterium]|nr:DUF3857 domain-containing protein [Myxococcota bacterium]MDW8283207.1 DUF3857 domain-containing protein [Myxococcales bacterium]